MSAFMLLLLFLCLQCVSVQTRCPSALEQLQGVFTPLCSRHFILSHVKMYLSFFFIYKIRCHLKKNDWKLQRNWQNLYWVSVESGKIMQVKSYSERFSFVLDIKQKLFFTIIFQTLFIKDIGFFLPQWTLLRLQLAFNTLCWLATEICPAAYL